ncbi:hypothetical protein G4B88_021404 [Cannabis sativa]|uniref:F-box domain-containing protein n=1 Tax=Cannabis sativa TaxID=3483 RepID=A0A7J6FI86_CANSA|nr:hypothetical protein G4B88_021404 [Cannabis sativa]
MQALSRFFHYGRKYMILEWILTNFLELRMARKRNQIYGSTINDIPSEIVAMFFHSLPTKSILFCKCVCKKWRNLIFESDFAKLNFAQAKPKIFVRTLDSVRVSRILYLVEPEIQDDPGFDLNLGKDNMELNAKLKIPLRNPESVLKNQDKKRGHNLKPIHNRRVHKLSTTCDDEDLNGTIDCGFGFSPRSGQYKVLRIYQHNTYSNSFAVVHTLGTDSWRSVIDHVPHSSYKLGFPTYLEGALYVLHVERAVPYYIISFNFDYEKFDKIELPPNSGYGSLSVLSGILCYSKCSCVSIVIWALKKSSSSSVGQSWSKMFAVESEFLPLGLYQPLHYFKSGAVLLFRNSAGGFMYMNSNGKCKYLGLCGLKSRYGILFHIPSLIPLKDIVFGNDKNNNIEILNVNTRCGMLKLHKETESKGLILKRQSETAAYGYLHSPSSSLEEIFWQDYWWKKY